jgi:hypothetical protein
MCRWQYSPAFFHLAFHSKLIWIRRLSVTYLVIFAVLAVALAPLIHVLPSKAQRRVAHLREFAALEGMFVEFRSAPQGVLTAWESARFEKGRTIYYGLRFPATERQRHEKRAWVWGEDGWRSLPRGGEVPASLAALPAEIFAASIDEGSCGIYWQELGDDTEIKQIKEALSALGGTIHS